MHDSRRGLGAQEYESRLTALELAYERNKLLQADERLAPAQPVQSSGTMAAPLATPPLEFGELAEDALLLAKQVGCRTTDESRRTPICHHMHDACKPSPSSVV